ncbi:MAG: hypothetical protein SFY67_01235 [Candidatus Melainabacteria bacterium]|nr:hypothetical protein [Candidatus Melainabacteria bacterium]
MTLTLSKDNSFLTEKQKAPAFSFFFRVHSGSEKQLHDAGHMRSKCHEVIKNASLQSSLTEELIKKVDQEIEKLDLHSGAKSFGIFVSPEHATTTLYYTYLPERQYKGEYFSALESLYAEQQSKPYALFVFEPRAVQVFKGQGDHLEAMEASPELEQVCKVYKHKDSTHADKDGKSHKGEHDVKWTKELLDAISALCAKAKSPAVLVGNSLIAATEEDFKKSSLQCAAVVEEVVHASGGSFQTEYGAKIAELIQANNTKEWLSKCNEAASAHKLVTGNDEMIACVVEGRAAKLLLETPAWDSTGLLEFSALHEIAREMLAKHGSVEFVTKNTLEKWGGQAMLLRY